MEPPSGAPVDRVRPGFVLGYPLRFSENQQFAAWLDGAGCASQPVPLTLALSPHDGADGLCHPANGCGETRSVRPGERLVVTPGDDLLQAASLKRTAVAPDGNGGTKQVEDQIELVTPAWAEMVQRSAVGYWLPVALVLAALYAVSFASTHQQVPVTGAAGNRARLRDLGVMVQRNQPLVRLQGLVWRRYGQPNGRRGAIMLRYLVAGPPVGRMWAAWTPPKRQAPPMQRVLDWLTTFRRFAEGQPIKDLGLTLVRLPRRR
jgi:hypothetical protein